MNVRKILFTIISVLLISIFAPLDKGYLAVDKTYLTGFVYSQGYSQDIRKLIVFYSPSCHKCIQVKNEIMPEIEKEFKDKIKVEYRDIAYKENYALLLSLEEKYKVKMKNVWPVFYFEGYFLNAEGQVKDRLKIIITKALNVPLQDKRGLPVIDLISHFKALTPFVVISGGLIDGINPCAFTVIVFFISFLALQGYRKRELVVIGLFFIFAVFLTYFLLGFGLFEFLYRLESFWIIRRIFNFSLGIFCIILGILAIYDFLKFKKTQKTEGLALQLPAAVKNQIHRVIGLHYRKTKGSQLEHRPLQKNILRLVSSALITGFLVSILEAVCTGQMYIPIITFVREKTYLKLQAVGYLLLYNIMFIVPLLVIFSFALLGVSSEQFSRFLKKNLLTVKILMAILFFGLGVFLVWRP